MNSKYFLLFFISAVISFNSHASEDTNKQADVKFEQGTVIVICKSPVTDDKVKSELFNSSFPNLIIKLQNDYNEGRIIRAHYLGSLKDGIFMLVGGENKDDALSNAKIIVDENIEIIKSAFKEKNLPYVAHENSCVFHEIGPVAIQ